MGKNTVAIERMEEGEEDFCIECLRTKPELARAVQILGIPLSPNYQPHLVDVHGIHGGLCSDCESALMERGEL